MNSVTWLGHATVLIEVDGTRVLTDPLLRPRLGHLRRYGPRPDPALWSGLDAVVISHLHWDHLDFASLRMLADDPLIVVPRGARSLLRGAGFARVVELAADETLATGHVQIRSTAANHSGFRPPFGPHADAAGYVVEGSSRVYFAGDTGLFPEMAALGPVDTALLPVGGWGPWLRGGHLDHVRAAEALAQIRPASVLPVHWGTYWPIGLPRSWRFREPGARFAARAATAMSEVDVLVATIGEPCTIPVTAPSVR
jgi:L-ascorbate metabolism protein UlaG (beta-lactamase superfamily)